MGKNNTVLPLNKSTDVSLISSASNGKKMNDFYRLLLINRQISSIIEYYRLIDYVFDDRLRLICNVPYQESENLTNNSTTILIVSSLLEYTFALP